MLVTGAGGFIGAELCAVLIAHGAHVVAMDSSEYSQAALAETLASPHLTVVLADIRNHDQVRSILTIHRPSHVYHAAAYKQVPFLEAHPRAAIANNAVAAWDLAEACVDAAVDRFVLVSSDKAAAAANVLGISKRLAEILVLGLNGSGTRLAAVRCANVLGSPGSVLPRFLEQISLGGPLNVTSPTAERYFMTLQEAVHAILYAGSTMTGREIFIPDAANPLRIVDLARKFILTLPEEGRTTISIELTTLRAGDQEQELLVAESEKAMPTSCKQMRVVLPKPTVSDDSQRLVSTLRTLCLEPDDKALRAYLQSEWLPGIV